MGFLEEAIMMIDFTHKNVLTLLAIAIDERDVAYVILPFMENGDLRKFVSDESNVSILKTVVTTSLSSTSIVAILWNTTSDQPRYLAAYTVILHQPFQWPSFVCISITKILIICRSW